MEWKLTLNKRAAAKQTEENLLRHRHRPGNKRREITMKVVTKMMRMTKTTRKETRLLTYTKTS